MKDFVLDAARELDLILVNDFLFCQFFLDFLNLFIQNSDFLLRELSLIRNRCSHINLLLTFLLNESIKLLNLPLIVVILSICGLNNSIFLGKILLNMLAILICNNLCHFLNLLNSVCSRFKPLWIAVLQGIVIARFAPDPF